MKHSILIVIGLCLSNFAFGQIIKIQTGISISELDWEFGNNYWEPFKETLIGNSLFVGIDYYEKEYFNLSSNLGFVRKGGKHTYKLRSEPEEPFEERTETAKLDYLSANTTIDLKYTVMSRLSPFISVGPRFDFLTSYSKVFDVLEESEELKKYIIGLILGGGCNYDLRKIQIGLRGDYYLNFSKVADWPKQTGNLGGKVADTTITLNLTIGYKL